MRYVALGILVWFICALIIYKIKEFDFPESLYLSLLMLLSLSAIALIIFLFVKYW